MYSFVFLRDSRPAEAAFTSSTTCRSARLRLVFRAVPLSWGVTASRATSRILRGITFLALLNC